METTSTAERGAAAGSPLPSLALPKGGGAIRGIGETFHASPATGSGSTTVPIPMSPGRGPISPVLSLSYDSGAGNGPFGIGWSLGLAQIGRSTDHGLPRYRDEEDSDEFLLAASEGLVRVLDPTGNVISRPARLHGIDHTVTAYRPRTEGLHARIERWTAVDSGESFWRAISRDNVTSIFGLTRDDRVHDPLAPQRTFSWLLSRTFDDKGNLAVYSYLAENREGVDVGTAHEANRDPVMISAQRYLKRIRYAADTPWFPDWSADGTQTPLPHLWRHEVVLDYGDHHPDEPLPQPDRPWEARKDPFSSYRAGFEVRTHRRVARFLLFHHFPEKANVGSDCLVRSTDLCYSDHLPDQSPTPGYSLLTSVTQTGHRRKGAGYLSRSMPPVEFGYSAPHLDPVPHTLDASSLEGIPAGIAGDAQLVDLAGEGMPGILSRRLGGWDYKPNLSPVAPEGASFGPPVAVATLPSAALEPGRGILLDLEGDGELDFILWHGPTPGFHERSADGWSEFRPMQSLPSTGLEDPNLRFVDLTGDGRADLLVTSDDAVTVHISRGEEGFEPPVRIPHGRDEQAGPRALFSDGEGSVQLADMSGDGLSDLVRVRDGDLSYWPSLGHGRFGRQITMAGALRTPGGFFDPARVRLADVDGSGTADLLYVGADAIWFLANRSGNDFADPVRIPVQVPAEVISSVQVVDLLGTGTACLVWSPVGQPPHYLDLMGGTKPHLMTMTRNNLGAETRITYAPSTRFQVADALAGKPWITRLPFPVQVIERVEVYDWIARTRTGTRYAYHHGHFEDREFRGFAMVEQWDTLESRDDTSFPETTNWDAASLAAPVLTRTWFHTGAYEQGAAISRRLSSEYWVEPAWRSADKGLEREACLLPDTVLPDDLTAAEAREAVRALRGTVLRTEVFALDGSAAAEHPFTVTEQSMTIERLQPFGPNEHAVFAVHPREHLTCHYDRIPDDPRVLHEITLETDSWGNVLRSMSVAYPRRPGPTQEPGLSQQFREMLAHDQARIHVSATLHTMTEAINDAARPHALRAPLVAESIVAEIGCESPASTLSGVTNRFTHEGAEELWQVAWDGDHDVDYEEVLAADIDGVGAAAATPTRRIVAHTHTRYRRDDLTGLLPDRELQPLALAGETWQLALTPGLLTRLFDGRLTNPQLSAAGYVQLQGHPGWWVPSGRVHLAPDPTVGPAAELAIARAHFFLPRCAVDPFGNQGSVGYEFDLVPVTSTDALGNTTSAEIDYRLLVPFRVTDPNGSRVEASFDVHGNVVANAASAGSGNGIVGDSLAGIDPDPDDATIRTILAQPLTAPETVIGAASIRLIYDPHAYLRTRDQSDPSPVAVYKITREKRVRGADPRQPTGFQHSLTYCDGFGREIQSKARVADGPLTPGGPIASPRWVGSGWTILDNLGRAIATYEPFFAGTSAFEFAHVTGVATRSLYDAAGRVAATLHPDSTWTKLVSGPWRQERWDAVDTVAAIDPATGQVVRRDPRSDPDVGPLFERLLGQGALGSWWEDRAAGAVGGTPDEREAQRDAATKAAQHQGTPTVTHFDSLGRACLDISDNGAGQRFPTRTARDAEDQPLAVIDALGRRVVENCLREQQQGGGFRYVAGFDMAGHPLYRIGMDDGERRSLVDVTGLPVLSWDGKGRVLRTVYDELRRPTHRYVAEAGTEILAERSVYGEAAPADRRLRGQLWRTYDGAGVAVNERYDYTGNLIESSRTLVTQYRGTLDWSDIDGLTDPAAIEAAAAAKLSPERFVSTTLFDALARPIQVVAPHSTETRPSVLRTSYDHSGRPVSLGVWVRRPQAPDALLELGTADATAVVSVEYDEHGRRVSTSLGDGTVTTRDFDHLTSRLRRLRTLRSGRPADQRVVQDLHYAYDPAGNVTSIRDDADIHNVVFFRNRRVTPSAEFTYDAVYRLISATGREHLGQNAGALNPPTRLNDDDSFRMRIPHPGDGAAMGTYTEQYRYDSAGNLLAVVHDVSSGSWTRQYHYDEESRITPTQEGNRLTSTGEPGRPADAAHAYDDHGLTTALPHLSELAWDDSDRLICTARQAVNEGVPARTHYVYAGGGERLRKVNDAAAATGQEPRRNEERIMLGPLEVHRVYGPDGAITMERETLHASLDGAATLLIETRSKGADPGPAQLLRYQHGNHLGSATLELDPTGDVISYEEYYPFGSTSYQAVRSQTETPKRYRYTAGLRDEESGLMHLGVRYYAPWLGRWLSPDPEGLGDGLNRYAYVRNNPLRRIDPSGTTGNDPEDLLMFLRNQAGFQQGVLTPITSSRQASAFGTWAHNQANVVLQDMKNLGFEGSERVFTEVAVNHNTGVVTKIGGSPIAGHHNLDAVVMPKGQQLTAGVSTLAPGQADIVGDFKYGRGTITDAHASFGQKGVTINHAFNNTPSAGAVPEGGYIDLADVPDAPQPAGPAPDAVKPAGAAAEAPKPAAAVGAVKTEASSVVKTETAAAKAEAKALKTEVKAVKAGAEALEVAGKGGAKTILKKLGTKALKVVPFVGMGAGVASAGYEASQGNKVSASLDVVGLVPVVGDVVDAARLGVAVGEAANEVLGIENVAAEHGAAVEGVARKVMGADAARIVGASGAAISAITVAPSIALGRTIGGWFK